MAKSNRQKYNFLAAFVSQLDQARDEGDDLAGQHAEVSGLNDLQTQMEGMNDRLGKCEQWLAQLELALEELDDDWSESSGEESDEDYDGLDDSELERVEPPMGGVRQPNGRVVANVGGARDRQSSGRSVTVEKSKAAVRLPTKKVRERGSVS